MQDVLEEESAIASRSCVKADVLAGHAQKWSVARQRKSLGPSREGVKHSRERVSDHKPRKRVEQAREARQHKSLGSPREGEKRTRERV